MMIRRYRFPPPFTGEVSAQLTEGGLQPRPSALAPSEPFGPTSPAAQGRKMRPRRAGRNARGGVQAAQPDQADGAGMMIGRFRFPPPFTGEVSAQLTEGGLQPRPSAHTPSEPFGPTSPAAQGRKMRPRRPGRNARGRVQAAQPDQAHGAGMMVRRYRFPPPFTGEVSAQLTEGGLQRLRLRLAPSEPFGPTSPAAQGRKMRRAEAP